MIEFQQHYNGRFVSMLHWHQLDELWDRVRQTQPNDWYVYLIGESVPNKPVDAAALEQFIQEVDEFLHQKHDYDYCGIVYADDRNSPAMIKIFDPTNLGAVCGSSGSRILPLWLLTRIPPQVVANNTKIPTKRWWQYLTFKRQ